MVNLEIGENPFDESAVSTIETCVERALKDWGILENIYTKTIFIKPNWNFIPSSPNIYSITDPRIVLAVCCLLQKYGSKQISIGEKPGQKRHSRDSYEFVGSRISLPSYVNLLELNHVSRKRVKTLNLSTLYLDLPQEYLDADLVIDIPKMKTHSLTQVTLGIKNLFGLLTDEEKLKHHNEDINQKLVDLLSVRRPDLTIIDGLFAMEGFGPLYGQSKKCNTLVISNDVVNADATASYLMGFNPFEIDHIRLSAEHGLGYIHLPRNLMIHQINFQKPDLYFNPFCDLKIEYGHDIPLGYFNALLHSLLRLEKENVHPQGRLYVGKFNDVVPEKSAVIFGDLTIASFPNISSERIAGHPPSAWALYDYFKGEKNE